MNNLFTSLLINLSKNLSRFSICATDLAFKLISMPRKKKKVKMSCRHCGEPNANSATHCMKCDTHHSKSEPCPDLSENQCTRASIINASEPSTNLTPREQQRRKKTKANDHMWFNHFYACENLKLLQPLVHQMICFIH